MQQGKQTSGQFSSPFQQNQQSQITTYDGQKIVKFNGTHIIWDHVLYCCRAKEKLWMDGILMRNELQIIMLIGCMLTTCTHLICHYPHKIMSQSQKQFTLFNLSSIPLYHLFILSENMLIKSFKKMWDKYIVLKQKWKKKLLTAYLFYWLFQQSVFPVVAETQHIRCPKNLKSIWSKSWVTSNE